MMEMLMHTPIGSVIAFGDFPYTIDRDRIKIPVSGEMPKYSTEGIPIRFDPYTKAPRVVQQFSCLTFDCCTDGWRRVE